MQRLQYVNGLRCYSRSYTIPVSGLYQQRLLHILYCFQRIKFNTFTVYAYVTAWDPHKYFSFDNTAEITNRLRFPNSDSF